MPRLAILPHSTAPSSAWKRGAWAVALDGKDPRPVPTHLPGWDYDTTMGFTSVTTVDADLLHEACGTSEESTYEFVCLWDCRAVGERIVAYRKKLPPRGTTSIEVAFEVPPRTVAERIRLERQVILSEQTSPPTGSPFSPSSSGAIVLWEGDSDVTSIALEGTGGRFPVEALDFTSQGLDDAGWWLSLAYDDPNDTFLGSARLYLNARHPAVAEVLESPESQTAKRILSAIQWDSTRRLLLEASLDQRFLAGPFEEGSVGDVIERISKSVLHRKDLRALFALISTDPDRFERMLQDRLRLFRDD